MIYNATDGTVLRVVQFFLDDDDSPALAKPGYPLVRLFDADKNTLSSVVASPTANPGEWEANVSIPNLGIDSKTELRIAWRFLVQGGGKILHSDALVVEPKVESRVSDVVGVSGDSHVSFTLPMFFGPQDQGTYQIYDANTPVLVAPADLLGGGITRTATVDRTNFRIPFPAATQPSLSSYLLRIDVLPLNGNRRTFTFKMWSVTPQIMLGMNHLEAFLNKSRIEQTIPELQYTDGDLVTYLERGLYLFNTLGNTPSAFTGTNMQGFLFDAWVTCASYYALCAQLLAEGSLSFDFNGQGVSLNVDRTPQLDQALGRIEGVINDRLVTLKKQLSKQGMLTGDGSIGRGSINNPRSIGTLSMIRATTTRLRGGSGMGGNFGVLPRN